MYKDNNFLPVFVCVCVEMFREVAPERETRRTRHPSGVSGEAPLQARELAAAQDHEVSETHAESTDINNMFAPHIVHFCEGR